MPRTAVRPQSLRTRWIHIPPRGSRSSGRKNAHRGSRRWRITASGPTRRQVPIAPEENSLSTTTMRQMPVLAQSQTPGGQIAQSQAPAQSQQPGFGSNADFAGSSIDEVSEVDVTATRYQQVGYDQSALHDLIELQMTAKLRAQGVQVVNRPTICLPGARPCGQPDIFGRNPDTKQLFALEIKTGMNPAPTEAQLNTYPHLPGGGVLVSGDDTLIQFGILPGEPLPPVALYFYYQLGPDTPGVPLRGWPPQ